MLLVRGVVLDGFHVLHTGFPEELAGLVGCWSLWSAEQQAFVAVVESADAGEKMSVQYGRRNGRLVPVSIGGRGTHECA